MVDSNIQILVVDESTERLELLIAALKSSGFHRISVVKEMGQIVERVLELKPDVILIEVESPNRDTLEQLTIVRDRHPTPVLMIAQDPEAQSIHAAVSSGVFAYSVGQVSSDRVRPAIEVAMATFESFKALRAELADAREKLNHQKRIDRAKCILIEQQNLTEQQAHQALRKMAMDRKRRLIDVADDLIAMAKIFRS